MNKIKMKVSREANFIYHMLSVAKCGYDNEYSREHLSKHIAGDLKVLKDNEKLITVFGGEHCGELYWLFVAIPASLDEEALEYYLSILNLFAIGDVESNVCTFRNLYATFLPDDLVKIKQTVTDTLNKYTHLKSQIVSMSDVMIRNYPIFCTEVWNESKLKLSAYADIVQQILDNNNISDKLEKITGISLMSDFIASLCNSIGGGAEAVDISANQDIFGIGRTPGQAKSFIAHEYAIYLLKQALSGSGTSAFSDMKNWKYTEALAEFYLSMTLGETGAFTKQQHIINFYKEEHSRNSSLTALALYRKAIEIFA